MTVGVQVSVCVCVRVSVYVCVCVYRAGGGGHGHVPLGVLGCVVLSSYSSFVLSGIVCFICHFRMLSIGIVRCNKLSFSIKNLSFWSSVIINLLFYTLY